MDASITKASKMLDAIAQGSDFQFGAGVDPESPDDLSIRLGKDSVLFTDTDNNFNSLITDPNVARFIAGALTYWANNKENLDLTGNEVIASLRLFGWANPAIQHQSINKTRAEWCDRNIKAMTPKAMKRHFEDLWELEKVYSRSGNDFDLLDVRNAKDILWRAMRNTDKFDLNPRTNEVKWKAAK